ncbi:MAG: chemotaxis protein CheD [Methanomicrobia archaeon]|nr:chemotaxis protein CheD [Methanomicrobia archaeon]
MVIERSQSESGDKGERYYAGIGEMKVAHNPSALIIMGLGSCIGLTFHDKYARVGGIAHIMLPDSKGSTVKSCKYADLAIPLLLNEMLKHDARKGRIVAKIAGGASMFAAMDTLQIGKKNTEIVKKALKDEGIRLVAEDTGGTCGRTITLDTHTGDLSVKTKDTIKKI